MALTTWSRRAFAVATIALGAMALDTGSANARACIGPQVGFALNDYLYGGSGTPPPRSFTPAFTGGLDMQFDAGAVGLDISAIYDMQGASFDATTDYATTTSHNNYVAMPILLKLNLVEGPTQVSLRIGPTVGLLVGATNSSGGSSVSATGNFRDFMLAGTAGLGVQFPLTGTMRLDVLARTQISILRVDNFDDNEPVRNLSLQILIAPLFVVGR